MEPLEEGLSPDQQFTLFHPSELELSETTSKVLKTVEYIQPSRVVVEDHEDTIEILARLLESAGYEVTAARTVAGALAEAAAAPFDLLVSDIGLPDAGGLDLMRQIRERFGFPGIALSGLIERPALSGRGGRNRAAFQEIRMPRLLSHLRAPAIPPSSTTWSFARSLTAASSSSRPLNRLFPPKRYDRRDREQRDQHQQSHG